MLKSQERPAVIRAIAEARSHGDLSENAEYDAARERQSFIEGRIAELEEVISSAEVIDPSTLSGDRVKFGAHVSVVDEETDKKMTYQIVGVHEADIKHARLSISSPLGQGADRQAHRRQHLRARPGWRPHLRDHGREVRLTASSPVVIPGPDPRTLRAALRAHSQAQPPRTPSMIGLADVQAAAERIQGRVLRTPSLHSRRDQPRDRCARDPEAGKRLQAIGSFKERGAANKLALAHRRRAARRRHRHVRRQPRPGRGPACQPRRHRRHHRHAALHAGHQGLPHRRLGRQGRAARRHAGRNQRPRAPSRRRTGLVFVHPYDDPAVMAGQGTLALELLADAPEIDVLLVPVGGGGMIAGCAAAAAELKPGHRSHRRPGGRLRRVGAAPGRAADRGRRPHHRRGHRRAGHRALPAGP